MGVRIGSGLSVDAAPLRGAQQAALAAGEALVGARADLVVVFASGDHLDAPDAVLAEIHEVLAPDALIGCGAAGVLGDGREVEDGTAISVWAAALEDGVATSWHSGVEADGDRVVISGFPDLDDAAGAIMLPDPWSFPTDAILREIGGRTPGVPVLGGVASARTAAGEPALFLDEHVVGAGAVGVRLDDIDLMPCVSQGAAPLGPEMTITAADGGVISELAGRPALERLRTAIEELSDAERRLLSSGLLLGIVVEAGKPDYEQGDFLVRGVAGTDTENGSIAVGSPVRAGQVVRLHARDARSAAADLRQALALRRLASGQEPPAGALLFSCNGRGRGMFGTEDHDARATAAALGGAPVAGFFAAGEIGPVGAASHLHGFTATLAIFPDGG